MVNDCNDPIFVKSLRLGSLTHPVYVIIINHNKKIIISIVILVIIKIITKVKKMLKIILMKVITMIFICLGAKHVRNKTKYVIIKSKVEFN